VCKPMFDESVQLKNVVKVFEQLPVLRYVGVEHIKVCSDVESDVDDPCIAVSALQTLTAPVPWDATCA
jgi:hypothetical protein